MEDNIVPTDCRGTYGPEHEPSWGVQIDMLVPATEHRGKQPTSLDLEITLSGPASAYRGDISLDDEHRGEQYYRGNNNMHCNGRVLQPDPE